MSIASRRLSRTLKSGSGSGGITEARYGLLRWDAYVPSVQDIQTAASRKYAVVVANKDRESYITQLKALDPDVKAIMYKCLCSARSYDGAQVISGGVSYTQALSNGWLALETSSQTIEWTGFPGHYQCKVWDSGYQTAWVQSAIQAISTGPWDGIEGDNDLSGTSYYFGGRFLQGTSSQGETDQLVHDGLDALLASAGSAFRSAGKLLITNFSESRVYPDRQLIHNNLAGGSMEEYFTSWSWTDGQPSIWFGNGWEEQITTVRSPGMSIGTTAADPSDTRTLLFGYGSFLLRADPNEFDAWGHGPEDPSSGQVAYLAEQAYDIGFPTGSMQRIGNVWTRNFERGWVAVNPFTSSNSVTKPGGGTQTLGALTAVILQV